MNKNTLQTELDRIVSVIKEMPGGVSIEFLMKKSGLKISLRSFQRRLVNLQHNGFITVSGNKRSTLYHFLNTKHLQPKPGTVNDFSFISDEGKRILALVTQPVEKRKAAGYDYRIVKKYDRNKGYFLPHEIKHLQKINKSVQQEHFIRKIENRLITDLSFNSCRLQGNNYSLLETDHLFLLREAAADRSASETQMLLNHREAVEFILKTPKNKLLNRGGLLHIHGLISDNMLVNRANCGTFRTSDIVVPATSYIGNLDWGYNAKLRQLFNKSASVGNPFEESFFLLAHLSYMQPLYNLNECVARIICNVPLIHSRLAPLTFTDLPVNLYRAGLNGVYELQKITLLKDLYIWSYERSASRYDILNEISHQPDRYILNYREIIKALMAKIIHHKCNRPEAGILIKEAAADLPLHERPAFTRSVENELFSLHEGNFVRYTRDASVFSEWKKNWYRERRPAGATE